MEFSYSQTENFEMEKLSSDIGYFKKLVEINRGFISWAGCQNNSIDASFHLQKSLKTFDKNSSDKIQSKNEAWVFSTHGHVGLNDMLRLVK